MRLIDDRTLPVVIREVRLFERHIAAEAELAFTLVQRTSEVADEHRVHAEAGFLNRDFHEPVVVGRDDRHTVRWLQQVPNQLRQAQLSSSREDLRDNFALAFTHQHRSGRRNH